MNNYAKFLTDEFYFISFFTYKSYRNSKKLIFLVKSMFVNALDSYFSYNLPTDIF